VGSALPAGCYLVAARGCDHPLVSDAVLGVASADGDAVACSCSIEEHFMFGSATGWIVDRERWRVSHAAEKGLRSLTVTGDPPPELTASRDEHAAKAGCGAGRRSHGGGLVVRDPPRAREGNVGFEHDDELPADLEGAFVALRIAEGSAAPAQARSTSPEPVAVLVRPSRPQVGVRERPRKVPRSRLIIMAAAARVDPPRSRFDELTAGGSEKFRSP
jgi:hypothetical protein